STIFTLVCEAPAAKLSNMFIPDMPRPAKPDSFKKSLLLFFIRLWFLGQRLKLCEICYFYDFTCFYTFSCGYTDQGRHRAVSRSSRLSELIRFVSIPEDLVFETGIRSPMPALLGDNLYCIDIAEQIGDGYFLKGRHTCGHGRLDPGIEPSLGSIDGHAVTFIGRKSSQRIVDRHPIGILVLYSHGVVNIHLLAEYAAIPKVTVMLLILDIQFHRSLVLADVPAKFTY